MKILLIFPPSHIQLILREETHYLSCHVHVIICKLQCPTLELMPAEDGRCDSWPNSHFRKFIIKKILVFTNFGFFFHVIPSFYDAT